jgi:hypothetical protein
MLSQRLTVNTLRFRRLLRKDRCKAPTSSADGMMCDDLLKIVLYQVAAALSVIAGVALAVQTSRIPLACGVLCVSCASIWVFMSTMSPASDVAGFVKFICEMPLGLGSLVLFQCLPWRHRIAYRSYFVQYVNVAVVGNIAMMVFVPDGGTMRGWTSRMACTALVIWLIKAMRAQHWVTQPLPQPRNLRSASPLFIFTAVPLPWIMTHACHRCVMITLPAFDSPRYVLLEILSLGIMVFLHWWYNRPALPTGTAADLVGPGVKLSTRPSSFLPVEIGRRQFPVEAFFGLADTICVATMGTVSHIADGLLGADTLRRMSARAMSDWLSSNSAARWMLWYEGAVDIVGVVVHVAVTLVCLIFILSRA